MNNSIFMKSMLASSIAIALGFTSSAYAQQSSTETADQVKAEERITVTGSRIVRKEESAAPVQVLNKEDIEARGALSLGEVLQEMPSVGASLNGNGSAGTSHGSSSLNLRNLGNNRSLILVNGNRWVNGAGTRGFRDFVDLNTIPAAIVSHVELLQDGATAIYGADAIAGVMNIHTYKDYIGTKVKAYYGQTSYGDRQSTNFDLLHGTDIGAANFMVAFSVNDQKPVYTQDRSLTAVPLNGLSAGTPQGVFLEDSLIGNPYYDAQTGMTRNPGVDGSDPNNWRAADSNDEFNRWGNNYVVGPSKRTALYAQWVQPFDDVTMRIEALYNNRKSDQLFSFAPAVVRGSRGFTIANDPSVNPFGVEFSGSDFRINNFFGDVGQRRNAQDVDTMRLGIGFEGYLGATWNWDAFASIASNKAEFVANNQIDLDRLALGLRACDATGISGDISDLTAGCTPVNMFNPLTADMIDYIRFTGVDTNESRQAHARVNFTGPVLELPAGELMVATGLEYRKEEGLDTPDAYASADPRVNTYRATSSAPRVGTDGEYDLYEAYVEFNAPLTETLEMTLASRFSDYSTFGSTVNSKVGFVYRPNDTVMFRTNWAEGFRAPSVLELFEGQRATFVPVIDPCSGGGAGLPGCAGVPNTYVQDDTQEPATVGGNRQLQPETSDNLNFGIVITPEAIPGLFVSLDHYNIKVDDTISTFGAQNLVNLCATTGRNCGVITRSASGEILDIVDGPVNLNSTEVAGYDFVTGYRFETDHGRWNLNLNISNLQKYEESSTLADGSTITEDLTGVARSRQAFPKWRSGFQAKWSQNEWQASYSWVHIGNSTETYKGEDRNIGTVLLHNIAATYEFDSGVQWKVGVNNLTNKQPPVSLTNANINFDINTYNPVGRFFYTQVSYSF